MTKRSIEKEGKEDVSRRLRGREQEGEKDHPDMELFLPSVLYLPSY